MRKEPRISERASNILCEIMINGSNWQCFERFASGKTDRERAHSVELRGDAWRLLAEESLCLTNDERSTDQ
ncbi:hypothetical protein AVEN_233476-1, partial [Araneus ventricosus]